MRSDGVQQPPLLLFCRRLTLYCNGKQAVYLNEDKVCIQFIKFGRRNSDTHYNTSLWQNTQSIKITSAHLTFQQRFVGERRESELCVFKSQIEFTLDSEWPLTRLKRSLQGVNLTPSQLFDGENF